MIKKLAFFYSIAALSFQSFTSSANGSWEIDDKGHYNEYFLSLEASYNKNSINNFFFNILDTESTLSSIEKNQPFGGRVAAGVTGGFTDVFAFSGELGFGYYGRTQLTPLGTGSFLVVPDIFTITTNIVGYDALAGLAYVQPCYNLFLKAGVLVEQMKTVINGRHFDPTDPTINDPFSFRLNRAHALPAIKLGGSYKLCKYLDLTAAYMHAFGAAPGLGVRLEETYEPILLISLFNDNLENPSIDSLMIGVNYQFGGC